MKCCLPFNVSSRHTDSCDTTRHPTLRGSEDRVNVKMCIITVITLLHQDFFTNWLSQSVEWKSHARLPLRFKWLKKLIHFLLSSSSSCIPDLQNLVPTVSEHSTAGAVGMTLRPIRRHSFRVLLSCPAFYLKVSIQWSTLRAHLSLTLQTCQVISVEWTWVDRKHSTTPVNDLHQYIASVVTGVLHFFLFLSSSTTIAKEHLFSSSLLPSSPPLSCLRRASFCLCDDELLFTRVGFHFLSLSSASSLYLTSNGSH